MIHSRCQEENDGSIKTSMRLSKVFFMVYEALKMLANAEYKKYLCALQNPYA